MKKNTIIPAILSVILLFGCQQYQPTTPPKSGGIIESNAKTINGVAYLPPNEEISIKYTTTSYGKTYNPYMVLQNNGPPGTIVDTKITNNASQNIQLSDIQPGDALVAVVYVGGCISAMQGGWSGCISNFYSIQDLSR